MHFGTYRLSETSAPAVEPVTLSEAKDYLREDSTDATLEALIETMIAAARELAEEYTGRAFIERSYEAILMAPPKADEELDLPKPPLVSVTKVEDEGDTRGTWETVDAADYGTEESDHDVAVLYRTDGWPKKRVRVSYTAGYGTATTDVPDAIRTAILRIVATLYDNPGDSIAGTVVAKLPLDAEKLLDPYRVDRWP